MLTSFSNFFGNYFVGVVSATLASVCSDCAMPSVRKKSIVPTSSQQVAVKKTNWMQYLFVGDYV
jgi:hypothetical protein